MNKRSSTQKRILFRLDSGSEMGLGHFMRCSALADELFKLGVTCHFAMQSVHQQDACLPHLLIKLENEEQLIEQLKSSDYQAVIIDHYLISSVELKKISALAKQLILLDDECNRGYLYADVIFNPVAKAIHLPYKKYAENAQYYFGVAYILLRSQFKQVKLIPYSQRENIILSLGGSDVKQLTLPFLKQWQKYFSHLPLTVISGASCKQHLQIQAYCAEFHINYRHNEKHMEQLFASAKLAISAAGSTLFELAKCGVPSIFALVADNQQLAVKEHQKQGWCSYVDCRKEKNVDKIIALIKVYLGSNELESKSAIAITSVDGQGAYRVAKIISQLKSS